MKSAKHPLEALVPQIKQYGLVVIDNVTSAPSYGKPYVSPYLIVALNHRGWLRADYDMQPMEFHSKDNAIIYPGHIIVAHESSDDYLVSLLVISPAFLKYLSKLHPNHYRFEYHYNVAFHLTNSQYEGIRSCFQLLQNISRLKHPNREDLLSSLMDVTAQLAEIYFKESGKMLNHQQSHVQLLMSKFHAAVAEHYKESREVRFYANMFWMSPKYFGTVVRQATGIGASEWIARYVIIQAKNLLRHQTDMTVQEISQQLGFSDQASFSRYFKTYAGVPPTEYREQ